MLGLGKKALPSIDVGELDDALDDFFGFVVIDREEIKQEAKADVEAKAARRKEKIEKEQNRLEEEKDNAQLLVFPSNEDASIKTAMVSDGGQSFNTALSSMTNRMKLEDFQIKKVIDKGSFGKVFHVVC